MVRGSMRRAPLFLLLAVLGGCPLVIEVRQDGGRVEPNVCATDFECDAGSRCEYSACVVGKRIGDPCLDVFDCPALMGCDPALQKCAVSCVNDSSCPPGYRCAPDDTCIEACPGVPATLGQNCESSLDCQRCGVCVNNGNGLRCFQRCTLDRDCGDAGVRCEGTTGKKTCRP